MAGRYKAGTIFLDVAPSFDQVQNKIRRYVEKDAGLNKLAEEAGREQGQAFAKGEAEARRKANQAIADEQARYRKTANRVASLDANKAMREAVEMARKTAQATAAVEQQSAKQSLKTAEDLAEQKKILQRQVSSAHDEAIKERNQREKDAAKKAETVQKQHIDLIFRGWRNYVKKHGDLFSQMLEAERREQQELADAMADGRIAATERRVEAEREAAAELERLMEAEAREDQALADAMAQGRIDAMGRRAQADRDHFDERQRMREAEAAAEKAQIEQWVEEWEEAQERIVEAREAANGDIARANETLTEHYAEQDARREEQVKSSGGRIGRLIRKTVGKVIEDLPDIELNADSTEVDRVMHGIRARFVALSKMRIGVDITAKEAWNEIRRLVAALKTVARTHDGEIRINALAAIASANALKNGIQAARRAARRPIILKVLRIGGGGRGGGIDGMGGSAEDGANAFRIFNVWTLAVVSALAMVGPMAAVAAAGLVSIAGAATAGAAGLGVLALAFQGVFQAIGDQIKAEDDLAKNGARVAQQRAASARRVRDAKESLADAETNAARASEDAARRVSDAERNLADAHRDAAEQIRSALETQREAEERVRDSQEASARAQRDLNDSRREAKRDIEDLAMAYRSAKLDEKEAAIAIVQAQERLADVRRRAFMGDASQADVADAQIGVQRARLRAEQARTRRARAGSDSARASRRGVEGSDQVMAAKDGVQQAARAERDAQKAVADAARGVADARSAGARRVADAERGVTDALRAQSRVAQDNARSLRDARQAVADAQVASMEQMSAASRNAKHSMSELSSEGQRFAKFILSLRSGYKELRDIAAAGVLPGLEKGMRELSVYEAGFKKFVGDMAQMWGDSFARMGDQMTKGPWKSFFATMGRDGPKQADLLNRAIFNVMTTVVALMDAFSPLTTDMLSWLTKATAGWADWAAGLKESEGFQRFLEYVHHIAPVVKDFFVSLGRAVIALGVALAPFAEGLMRALTNVFDFIAEMDPKTLGLIAAALIGVFLALQFGAGALALFKTLVTPFHNRLALVVTVLSALVFGLIYLYQTNDTAKKYIDKFIGALKVMGRWILDNIGLLTKIAGAIAGLFILYKVVKVVMAVRRAMMLLGLTMKLTFLLNPYVLAIAALIGIIVYLWKTNETFRKVVKAVWNGIKATISWVWNKVLKPIFAEMVLWWKEIIAPALTWLWKSVFRPIFKAIGNLISIWWNEWVKPIFMAWVYVFKTLVAPVLQWIWNKVIKPVFKAIGSYIWGKWNRVILPVLRAFRKFLRDWLGPAIDILWAVYVKPVFGWIAKKARWLWDKVRPNLDKFKRGVDAVKDAFKRSKDGIKRIWDGLVDVVRNPIVAALKFIQTYFIDGINKLLKKAGLKMRLPDILVKVRSRGHGAQTGSWRAAGLAKGGILPGYTPMHRGDDRLTPMRSGEGVLVSEGLRDNRSRSMFLAANDAAKRGTSFADFMRSDGFAKGGIVDLGKRIQKMGYHVSEHPAFGGVAPGAHSASGYHYRGGALDINADSWNSRFGSEMGALDKLNSMLRSEGWNTIWRAKNHWDHLHVDIARGQRGGLLGSIAEKALNFLADKAKGVISKIPGDSVFSKMSKSLLKKSIGGIKEKILNESSMLDMGEGSVHAAGVGQYRDEVGKALKMLGQSPLLTNTVLRRMAQESGGNYRAINNWDSNARRGTPSKGLMQVIDPTFQAYKMPGYGNIWDPLSNILASMRYALARYGSLSMAYNRQGGYARGTDSATAGWHMVGENGPELLRFNGGEQVYNRQQTMRLAELGKGGSGARDNIYVQNPWTGEYLLARTRDEIQSNDDFKESVGRMGHG